MFSFPMMIRGSVLCLLFVFQLSCGQQSIYRATFNMLGYDGEIEFSVDTASTMTLSVDATAKDFTNISIMTLPAVFGQAGNVVQVCNNLGSVIENIPDFTNMTQVVSLSADTIFNRGIRVTTPDGQNQLCATILPYNDVVETSRAMFIGPIVGQVWIRTRPSTNGLFSFSNLSYSVGVSVTDEPIELTLKTYSEGTIDGENFENRCSQLSAPADLIMVTAANGADAPGKESAVFTPSASKTTLTKYVGLVNAEQNLVACAELFTVAAKNVTSVISWDNIRGTVTMTQNSIFDSTKTMVKLSGIRETPAMYHVHEFPVPQRLNTKDQRCSVVNVAGHYNPYGVVIADSPTSGTGTDDEYEIGDLSGKYGSLSGNDVEEEYDDWNLPLFGVHSVVGRSLVIHYPNGSRWVCASIGYPAGSSVVTAVVRFNYPAYGFMYFRQEQNNPFADATIFGEIANLNGEASMNQNYHVHRDPVGADCASAGPHYDPASLSQSPNYLASCSPLDPFQCEIGDLSRRHGGINIGTQLRQTNKFFVTDSYISLSGDYSIMERSIVVHDENAAAPRYACGNITAVHLTKVRTVDDDWTGRSDGTVTGHLEFTQETQYDRAEVVSSVTGLASQARTYHIHVLPIDSEFLAERRCSVESVGGHFDPFGIGGTPTPKNFTFDKYEVGDLSGKYGLIDNTTVISLNQQFDNNLPFTTGLVSCAGRSVVIHRADATGSRWKCNTIELQPGDSTGHVVTARAAFTTSNAVTGFVDWRQVVYEDGSASVTSILVRLFNRDFLTFSLNHNWHIHIDPVLDQSSCGPALGHYDPYQAVATSSNYSVQCNRLNPFACEVGDLSNKQMQYTINGQREVYIDEDVPLHTDRTVLGRSVVFHTANGEAPRLACANILPTTNTYTLTFASSVTYDYYRFTYAVAKSLSIARSRVIVLHNVAVPIPGGDCSRVLITIAGNVNGAKLDELIMGTNSDLSPYQPTSKCKSQAGIEILGLSSYEPNAASTVHLNLLTVLASALMITLIQKMFD